MTLQVCLFTWTSVFSSCQVTRASRNFGMLMQILKLKNQKSDKLNHKIRRNRFNHVICLLVEESNVVVNSAKFIMSIGIINYNQLAIFIKTDLSNNQIIKVWKLTETTNYVPVLNLKYLMAYMIVSMWTLGSQDY